MADNSNFDTATFAVLLEKAKGDRSINQYASDTDISAAHISRLLRKMVSAPPSPDTLNKLAKHAHNGVTYGEFMGAAGYIDQNRPMQSQETVREQASETEAELFKVILSELYLKGLEWSMSNTIQGPPDFIIEIKNWEYTKWYIELKTCLTSRSLYEMYGRIAAMELSQHIKYSVCVGSRQEFDMMRDKPPKALRANLFIALADTSRGEIIKEEKLCHY